jgi:hypothetical protein
MNKKFIFFPVAAFASIFFFVSSVLYGLSPEIVKDEKISDNESAQKNSSNSPELTIFVSIPDVFKNLERPPVKFNHDKHTLALEKEGCEECHPKNIARKLLFEFPIIKDESSRDALMNSFHDACIGCHNEKLEQDEKAGPVTCGECHVIEPEYLPIMPEYYDTLRDTYHKECKACHTDPVKKAEDAGALDWKGFYIKDKTVMEEKWPVVSFDYYLHDKHEKALEKECGLCHFISPEEKKRILSEKNEPSCRDWLMEIPEEQSLSKRDSAHPRCINCHLERKEEQKKAGPVYCRECHTGIERTVEQQSNIPRENCEQEDKILILVKEDARMKGVPFSHKLHEEKSLSCQACHHDTLKACNTCHTIKGSEEGNFITLSEAYHEISSVWSCLGCHESEKKKPECAGCHNIIRSGLSEVSCDACHSGSLEDLDNTAELKNPDDILPDDLADEMEIDLLKNEYEQSKFPHLKIINKLIDISNKNNLARYFHSDETDFCSGCHHYSPVEAKKNVSPCSACHTSRKEPENNTPALLGAYHRSCLGCHKAMGGTEEEKPQTCTGCHKEKENKTIGQL